VTVTRLALAMRAVYPIAPSGRTLKDDTVQ